MFDGKKFITRGVNATIPLTLQLLLWQMIDTAPVPKDYLQVFKLSVKDQKLHIEHSQEEPSYKKEIDFQLSRDEISVSASLFVIDDGDHSTMLMAEEY